MQTGAVLGFGDGGGWPATDTGIVVGELTKARRRQKHFWTHALSYVSFSAFSGRVAMAKKYRKRLVGEKQPPHFPLYSFLGRTKFPLPYLPSLSLLLFSLSSHSPLFLPLQAVWGELFISSYTHILRIFCDLLFYTAFRNSDQHWDLDIASELQSKTFLSIIFTTGLALTGAHPVTP